MKSNDTEVESWLVFKCSLNSLAFSDDAQI